MSDEYEYDEYQREIFLWAREQERMERKERMALSPIVQPRTYTCEDMIRAIFAQQWAVAITVLDGEPTTAWDHSDDIRLPRRL